MLRRALCTGLLVAFASLGAAAQDGAPPPAPKPAAAPTKDGVLPVTLENLQVKPEELPKGMRIVEGDHPVTPHAYSFFLNPTPAGLFEAPAGKASQSLAAEGRKAGTVFLFEYAKAIPRGAKSYLLGLLWGDGKGPSTQEPEEMIVQGRFLILLSFPRGDPAAEWFKERLRKRLRIRAMRCRPEVMRLVSDVNVAYEAHDPDGGTKTLQENAKIAEGSSWAQFLFGEFGLMKKDWVAAERGYSAALALDESLEDPLEPGLRWASVDGLASSQLAQKKIETATTSLRRSLALAAELKIDPKESSNSDYNLACALAIQKNYAEALEALKGAIKKNPKWKASARDDEDFAEARKRPDFQALLKE
jgi:tetratricopeptide (TPR) repeat protein